MAGKGLWQGQEDNFCMATTAMITVSTASELKCQEPSTRKIKFSESATRSDRSLRAYREEGGISYSDFKNQVILVLSLAIPRVLPYFLQCSRHLPWGVAGLTHPWTELSHPSKNTVFSGALWGGKIKTQTNNKNQGLFKPKSLRQTTI